MSENDETKGKATQTNDSLSKEEMDKIDKEIQTDNDKKIEAKTKEITDTVTKEVTKTITEKVETDNKLKELASKVEETNKANEDLKKELETKEKELEEASSQRKGLVDNDNPLKTKKEKEPTLDDLGKLVDENAVDKTAALKKTLGL